MKKSIVILIILIIIAIGAVSYYIVFNFGDEEWKEYDGISLMRSSDFSSSACYGCNDRFCVDPPPGYVTVTESKEIHCNDNFEIITAK